MSTNILVFMFALFLVTECKLPDYIQVCKRTDPKLDDCIIKSIYSLLPKLKEGIPELHLPSIEPLHLKNIDIKSGSGAVNIDVHLKDFIIWNAATFEITHFKAHIEKNMLELGVKIPELQGTGNYEADTNVLALHIKGKGPFSLNITEYDLNSTLHGSRVIIDDKEHLQFEKMHFDIKIGSAKVRLDNLFHGNENLGKATNDVINDNIDGFYEAFKPYIEDGLEEAFTEITNKIFLKFELKELFPL